MALTAEGRALYEFVKPFFDGLPGIVRAVRQRTFGGTLTVHAGGMLVRKLLPGWFGRLKRTRPDITIDLHEAEEPAISLLRAGQTDLVVDFIPAVPPDVVTMRVATTFAFAVVPSSHVVTGRRRPVLAELGRETFISYPRGSTPCELQMSVLESEGIVPSRTVSVGSADSILGFVEAGVGWSIIPWLDPEGPKSAHLRVRRLQAPRGGFPVHVAYRKHDAKSPLIVAALAAVAPK